MPTKRQFDLVILVGLLLKPATGLVKMWAARIAAKPDTGPVVDAVAGAVQVVG